jgi:hypothetical protein
MLLLVVLVVSMEILWLSYIHLSKISTTIIGLCFLLLVLPLGFTFVYQAQVLFVCNVVRLCGLTI